MFMSLPRLLMLPVGLPLQVVFVIMKLIGKLGTWLDNTMMRGVRWVESRTGWVELPGGWYHFTDAEYRAKFKRDRIK